MFFFCTETYVEDERRVEIKFLENIVHKRLYSKPKATKMLAKTLFRMESYLRSTTYVRGLTCYTQDADFVLQDRIGKMGGRHGPGASKPAYHDLK